MLLTCSGVFLRPCVSVHIKTPNAKCRDEDTLDACVLHLLVNALAFCDFQQHNLMHATNF